MFNSKTALARRDEQVKVLAENLTKLEHRAAGDQGSDILMLHAGLVLGAGFTAGVITGLETGRENRLALARPLLQLGNLLTV